MGRTKQYDKDEVLQKALELFWDNGYHATGMSDLEAAMGINKFGIYSSFGSKHGLMLAAADRFFQTYQIPAYASLDEADPVKSILAFFQRALAIGTQTGHNGCFLLLLGIEFNHAQPEIQARIEASYRLLETRLLACLEAAKSRQLLAVPDSPKLLASFLRTYLEGILSRGRHGAGEETKAGVRVLANLFRR